MGRRCVFGACVWRDEGLRVRLRHKLNAMRVLVRNRTGIERSEVVIMLCEPLSVAISGTRVIISASLSDMGHSAKVHKRVVSAPPSRRRRTLIVRSEKACFIVDIPAKTSGSIGVIYAVGQETRRSEIQGQGEIWHQGHAGRCFGRCRLCHIAVGRSKKGSRGSDETTTRMILT
jgi:hypothetical protein